VQDLGGLGVIVVLGRGQGGERFVGFEGPDAVVVDGLVGLDEAVVDAARRGEVVVEGDLIIDQG
jgi:hypothetical protein